MTSAYELEWLKYQESENKKSSQEEKEEETIKIVVAKDEDEESEDEEDVRLQQPACFSPACISKHRRKATTGRSPRADFQWS